MESVKRAVAVEIENPKPELYAVEEQYRRIVEEVATYVTGGGDAGKGEIRRAVPPFQKAVPPARPANPAGHKPRRRNLQIVSRVEERRPDPQAPSSGGVGLHPLRQRQLELPKDDSLSRPSQNCRIAPRQEERGLDKAAYVRDITERFRTQKRSQPMGFMAIGLMFTLTVAPSVGSISI